VSPKRQYGVQVTPLQLIVGVATLATDGTVLRPALVMGENDSYKPAKVDLPQDYYTIVKEGMRLGVKEGIARALDLPGITVAAKSGTAELGTSKKLVNSWIMGFFPYEKPRYAFVIVMEKGSRENREGAVVAGRDFFEWLSLNRMELFE
jgi:penicillin-binding protein 2